MSDLVFEQLRESIYRGDLKTGERLPSERELALCMRVSRSTVRKALTRLLDLGYVKILDAIKCRDGENASRYMLQHITFLRGFLKETAASS